MSKFIKSIAFTRLRKLELPHFANQVLNIVSKHDAEELKIKEAFDMLEGLQPLMKNLEDRYGAHPLTKKMDRLHKSRIKYADLIINQMRVYIKADNSDKRGSLDIVEPEVSRSLVGLQRNSYVLITEKINQFIERVHTDENLADAMSVLELTEYLDSLESANMSYIKLEEERIASIAARPKLSIPPIVKEVNAALRNLFNQVELSNARNLDLDYFPLIHELNVVISNFNSIINLRATINKKKADEAVEDTESVETNVFLNNNSCETPPYARFSALSSIVTPPAQVNVEIVGKNGGFVSMEEDEVEDEAKHVNRKEDESASE